MATATPWGTDLNPIKRIRIVGGRQVEVSSAGRNRKSGHTGAGSLPPIQKQGRNSVMPASSRYGQVFVREVRASGHDASLKVVQQLKRLPRDHRDCVEQEDVLSVFRRSRVQVSTGNFMSLLQSLDQHRNNSIPFGTLNALMQRAMSHGESLTPGEYSEVPQTGNNSDMQTASATDGAEGHGSRSKDVHTGGSVAMGRHDAARDVDGVQGDVTSRHNGLGWDGNAQEGGADDLRTSNASPIAALAGVADAYEERRQDQAVQRHQDGLASGMPQDPGSLNSGFGQLSFLHGNSASDDGQSSLLLKRIAQLKANRAKFDREHRPRLLQPLEPARYQRHMNGTRGAAEG